MKTVAHWSRLAAGLFLFLVSVLLAPTARGQATGSPPELMTYQGFLADASGAPLASDRPRNYDIVFRIFDNWTEGNRVWAERQTVTVDKGYFSVLIGRGTAVSGEVNTTSFSDVFASGSASERYIGLTVIGLGGGGSDLVIEPRLRLLPGPYAFLSKNANALANAAGSQVVSLNGNAVNISNAGSSMTVNGPITANSFSGNGANVTAIDANKISTGTVPVARIPSLDTSKIATGIFVDARIPSLGAAKITTGIFADARIPNLNASKITDGTLSDARLSLDVAKLSGSQTFGGHKNFHGGFTWTGFIGPNLVVEAGKTPGYLAMRDRPINLRSENDANHRLVHGVGFGGVVTDGPVLHGYAGGILGSTVGGNYPSVRWSEGATEIWGREATASFFASPSTAWSKSQHLLIRARDKWGSEPGNRLSLGMAYAGNTLEAAGIIQAYQGFTADSSAVANMRLNPMGGGVYATISGPSDRNIKTGIQPVDSRAVLQKLIAMPVSTWAFTNSVGVTHMGPMAQDFHEAFQLGDDPKAIVNLDASGVAMAAIQGLHSVVQEKDEEIQSLRRELGELRSLVEKMIRKETANLQ